MTGLREFCNSNAKAIVPFQLRATRIYTLSYTARTPTNRSISQCATLPLVAAEFCFGLSGRKPAGTRAKHKHLRSIRKTLLSSYPSHLTNIFATVSSSELSAMRCSSSRSLRRVTVGTWAALLQLRIDDTGLSWALLSTKTVPSSRIFHVYLVYAALIVCRFAPTCYRWGSTNAPATTC